MAKHDPPAAKGGDGGSAEVSGNGVAIGGAGGQAAGEPIGVKGGDGGGGRVDGDGVVIGGAGGHVAGPGVWLPPAKSGGAIIMKQLRQLGVPFDRRIAEAGMGGAMPGYNERLAVVDEIRAEYLRKFDKMSEENMYDGHSVPLDVINQGLEARNETWRAEIFGDDQFAFYAISSR